MSVPPFPSLHFSEESNRFLPANKKARYSVLSLEELAEKLGLTDRILTVEETLDKLSRLYPQMVCFFATWFFSFLLLTFDYTQTLNFGEFLDLWYEHYKDGDFSSFKETYHAYLEYRSITLVVDERPPCYVLLSFKKLREEVFNVLGYVHFRVEDVIDYLKDHYPQVVGLYFVHWHFSGTLTDNPFRIHTDSELWRIFRRFLPPDREIGSTCEL